MKRDLGARLAAAGLGTALSVLFITLSFFIRNLSLSFTVLAALGVMVPLAKGYFREGILTSVASSVIGFFIANISVLSYVLASSFYIVFTIFWMQKKLNKILGYGIKAAYSILVFFILYKLTTLITIDFALLPALGNLSPALLYIILNALFTVAFIIYDIAIGQVFVYLQKVILKVKK